MSEEYLTIKEIARTLEVPESNIRYYRDRFQEFLPAVGQGRKKRYKAQALEVFRYIVQAYQNDLSTEQVAQKLQHKFPRHLLPAQELQDEAQPNPDTQQPMSFHSLLQSQASTLESLSQVLLQKDTINNEVYKLAQEQQRLKKGLVLLWKSSKRQGHADNSDKSSQADSLHELRLEIKELGQRQEELRSWVEGELQGIKEQLKKSQFWTKRLLLQQKQETDSSSEQD
ncbi:MAG: MerR family transcriptional regulator [Desulfohalobiaceae bacterium]